MKRVFSAALLALAVFLQAFAASPAAADGTTHLDLTLPYNEDVRNTCSGDIVNFTGMDHVLIQITDQVDSWHFKLHANGRLDGIVVVPGSLETVGQTYVASHTEDQEWTQSKGNDIYNLVTTFVAVNQADPKLNMRLIAELQINMNSKEVFKSQTNSKCGAELVVL